MFAPLGTPPLELPPPRNNATSRTGIFNPSRNISLKRVVPFG